VNGDWYDKELYSYKDFVVVPGLGPLAAGYLMILPRAHYLSVASLPPTLLRDLIDLKSEVRRVIAERFADPIFFEHGPSTSKGGGGSCVDHAHIHVLPTQIDLVPVLRSRHQGLQNIRSIEQLREFRGTDYVFYEDQNGEMYSTHVTSLPGQYVRRVLAQNMGLEDSWDYAAYPNYSLIRSTISRLSPWPGDAVSRLLLP
jgi:ATP adenylyltransferase